MKTIRLLSGLFLFALIFSLSGFTQSRNPQEINHKPEFKTDVVGSYPTDVLEYIWNVEYWDFYQHRYITYTAYGELSEVTIIGENGYSRSTFTYNSNRMLTEKLEQKKIGEEWLNDRRERIEYNDGNLPSQELVESWVDGDWVLTFGSQYSYNTDQEGVMVVVAKIWSRDDSAWINSTRTTFIYGSEMMVAESITETWEDGAWKNSNKTRFVYEEGRIIEMYLSGWLDSDWVGSTKMLYEYRENDSYTMTIYTGAEGNWTPSQRFTENFDTHGNAVMSLVEIYAMDWMLLSGSEYILTYDGDNLTERITKVTGLTEPGVWKNSYKEIFSSFISLSTNPLEFDSGKINHYPNPAGEYVSLDIQNLGNKNLDIVVLDLTGKVLKTDHVFVPVSNYKYIVPLNDLSSGVYIIQAREKSGKLIQSMRVIHED